MKVNLTKSRDSFSWWPVKIFTMTGQDLHDGRPRFLWWQVEAFMKIDQGVYDDRSRFFFMFLVLLSKSGGEREWGVWLLFQWRHSFVKMRTRGLYLAEIFGWFERKYFMEVLYINTWMRFSKHWENKYNCLVCFGQASYQNYVPYGGTWKHRGLTSCPLWKIQNFISFHTHPIIYWF